MRHFKSLVVAAAAACSFVPATAVPARAATIVSEDFSYGGTTAALDGQNGGTGFNGAWSTATSVSYEYTPTSLTMSSGIVSVPSTGGAARLLSGNNVVDVNRPFSTAVNTALGGTVYGSYLVQVNQNAGIPRQGLSIGAVGDSLHNSAGNLPSFGLPVDGRQGNTKPGLTIEGTDFNPNLGGITGGTTYLHVFRIDNSAGTGPKTLTSWFLLPAQLENFFADFQVTEAELNAAAEGGGNAQVAVKMTTTQSIAVGTTTHLHYTRETSGAGNFSDATFDRLRFSDASINEAIAAVPEPASIGLLGLGAIGLLARRRRTA